MVLDLVDNDDVVDFVWGRPASIKKYVYDTLLALQELHDRNIIYRDIKPANIMWSDAHQKAVLIDFDIATFMQRDNLHRSRVGTDGFMAPELRAIDAAIRAEEALPLKGYDQKVDVWAVGVCLAALLFESREEDVMDDVCLDDKGETFLRKLKRMNKQSRGKLAPQFKLCGKMLATDPGNRCSVKDALAHSYFDSLRKAK
jgi:serine/threonine protein kinase